MKPRLFFNIFNKSAKLNNLKPQNENSTGLGLGSNSRPPLTLHVDHLAGHLVVRRIVGIVEGLVRLQHLGRGDDQARAYCPLQMVFLQEIMGEVSFY